MAHLRITHERDSTFFIEVFTPDPADDNYDGNCPRCPFTISEGGTRTTDLADAVMAADVHLDYHHPEV